MKYHKNMDKYESYDITDEQWKVIEPLMPPEYTGKKGRPRKDNRTMVNGILWINRSGAQWRQLPEKYELFSAAFDDFHTSSKNVACIPFTSLMRTSVVH